MKARTLLLTSSAEATINSFPWAAVGFSATAVMFVFILTNVAFWTEFCILQFIVRRFWIRPDNWWVVGIYLGSLIGIASAAAFCISIEVLPDLLFLLVGLGIGLIFGTLNAAIWADSAQGGTTGS